MRQRALTMRVLVGGYRRLPHIVLVPLAAIRAALLIAAFAVSTITRTTPLIRKIGARFTQSQQSGAVFSAAAVPSERSRHHVMKEDVMSKFAVALLMCVFLGQSADLAQAGACSEEIAQLRQAAASSGAAPTAPQSVGAQLRRQPTPSSVEHAEQAAQSNFADLLSRAEGLDAEGKHAECMQAVTNAKRMLELD